MIQSCHVVRNAEENFEQLSNTDKGKTAEKLECSFENVFARNLRAHL